MRIAFVILEVEVYSVYLFQCAVNDYLFLTDFVKYFLVFEFLSTFTYVERQQERGVLKHARKTRNH